MMYDDIYYTVSDGHCLLEDRHLEYDSGNGDISYTNVTHLTQM